MAGVKSTPPQARDRADLGTGAPAAFIQLPQPPSGPAFGARPRPRRPPDRPVEVPPRHVDYEMVAPAQRKPPADEGRGCDGWSRSTRAGYFGQGPQLTSITSRSSAPTFPSPSKSAEPGPPHWVSSTSRSAAPTMPSPLRSHGHGGAPLATRLTSS